MATDGLLGVGAGLSSTGPGGALASTEPEAARVARNDVEVIGRQLRRRAMLRRAVGLSPVLVGIALYLLLS
jgi:hypothetical protein